MVWVVKNELFLRPRAPLGMHHARALQRVSVMTSCVRRGCSKSDGQPLDVSPKRTAAADLSDRAFANPGTAIDNEVHFVWVVSRVLRSIVGAKRSCFFEKPVPGNSVIFVKIRVLKVFGRFSSFFFSFRENPLLESKP